MVPPPIAQAAISISDETANQVVVLIGELRKEDPQHIRGTRNPNSFAKISGSYRKVTKLKPQLIQTAEEISSFNTSQNKSEHHISNLTNG